VTDAQDSTAEALGQIAYEADAELTNWRHFDGRTMPPWDRLGPVTRQRYSTIALAVADALACTRCGTSADPSTAVREASAPRA